jgi:endonuclease-3
VEAGLERVTPDAYRRHAHHWLILHGRYVCKALRPDCTSCVVRDLCAFVRKPVRRARPAPEPRG